MSVFGSWGCEQVCWTRMQAESGQALSRIVLRKDTERRAGDGLFFWGVGNAPARAIAALARTDTAIGVVFSVMKSRPKPQDVSPARVVAWNRFIDQFGVVRSLPEHILVTSRAGRRDCHYALMCRSDYGLEVGDEGPFDPAAYRNFGAGKPVGASQTTALLERHGPDGASDYRVAMRAELTGAMWTKLVDPVEVPTGLRQAIDDAPADEAAWLELVRQIRRPRRPAPPPSEGDQRLLFAL